MDGREGVADGALGLGAGLQALVHGGADVAQVVEGVENADDVHAVLHRGPDEAAHRVVGVVMVAQQVLAAQEHLELGVLQMGLDGAQALPGVLPQVPQAGIKRSAAPALHRMVACLVHGVQNVFKVGDGQPGGHE